MSPAAGFLEKMGEVSGAGLNFSDSLQMMGHSALLGLGLMLLTAWASSHSVVKALKSEVNGDADSGTPTESNGEKPASPSEIIFSSANVLYLCFGMTGMMLIVNNNIARAFAIAAAIALVRFRIKVNSKLLSMSLFYGVLTGMACGVGHVLVAYILVLFFGLLQTLVLAAAKIAERKAQMSSASRKQPAISKETSPATV